MSPTNAGNRHLRAALRRLSPKARPPLEAKPESAFDHVVLERLRGIDKDLDEIRARVNWLLVVIVGAALAQLLELLFSVRGAGLR